MDDFDLILDAPASVDEDTSIELTGTINNIDAPGSEVTIDIDWGDSTTDTVDIIDGGSDDSDGAENGSISFSVPHVYSEDGTFDINVDAQEQIISGTDAVFVIDESGSTGSSSGIDIDGDGSEESILEAEVAAFQSLNQNLIDQGLGDSANVSIVAFDSSATLLDLDPAAPGVQTFTTPLADTDGNGARDIDEALDALFSSGGTDFEDALLGAVEAVNNAGTPPGGGTVVFLSDGEDALFDTAPADTIRDDLGQSLRAFGVGSGSDLASLQEIDPSAEQFDDISELLGLFDGTGGGAVDNSDSASVTIAINDVPETPETPETPDVPIIPNLVTEPVNSASEGTAGDDGLTGTDGDDLLEGLGGNDQIDGGAGVDTIVYQFDPAGVTVDLFVSTATDGNGDSDTITNVENIIGSEFADNLTGDDNSNNLTGRNGDDTIAGQGGDDFIVGSAGVDNLAGGAGADSFFYITPSEGGDNIVDFEVGIDEILIVGATFPSGLSGGTVPSDAFFSGSAAADDNDRFGFDSSTGEVLFDADGSGSGGIEVLATLDNNPTGFSNTDITIL